MRSIIKKFIFVFMGLAIMAGPVRAAEPFTPEQTEAVKAIVAQYLKDNPQAIIDSVNSMREKEEKDQQAKAEQNIGKNLAGLTAADLPSAGSKTPDVTVVEFFDYHCGYCKRALPDVQALLQSDKNVRVVFHEMPILSQESNTAALWALAAHKQGKYFEYHVKLMQLAGAMDEAALTKVGKDLGLDTAKLKTDAASPEVAASLEKSLAAARDIGINGTPAFIINGKLFPGYLGEEGLKASVAEARKAGQ